jgi:hypothetical protein
MAQKSPEQSSPSIESKPDPNWTQEEYQSWLKNREDKNVDVIDVESHPVSEQDTSKDLGETQKLGSKGFVELPEQERRRRYKEMKETEEKEKQEAMADARAKVEASYSGKQKEVQKEKQEEQPNPEVKKEEPILEKPESEEQKDQEKTHQNSIKFLFGQKKEVEIKLSKTEGRAEKEELLQEKRELAQKILAEARQIPQFKDIEFEIQREQEKQWEQSIAASGYKSMDNYVKWHENIYYDEVIKGSNLSEKQKEEISEHGSIIVSNWPKTIELEKGDVAIALKMGIDINTIKGPQWWNLFSKKIQVGDKVFDNIGKLNEHFVQGKVDKINGEIFNRVDARKREIIEKSSDPIIDNKIQKLTEVLFGSKKASKQEASVEDRLGLLGKLRSDWNKANEIHTALKDKNWKIKTPDGKLIIGSEAKAQMEQKLGELSEDIIKAANQIEARNLKKEAIKATDYKLDKDPQKQKEYRRWLTDEVKKIFEKERGSIEKTTGKKVVARRKNRAENKTETVAVTAPQVAKPESELVQPEMSPQPEAVKTRGVEIKKPEIEIETLPGYEIGQKVDIVFPDPENMGYYISDKGSIFKGVREDKGEKIVVLEKDGRPYSMLLELFLETQKKKTLAQDPEELTRDLPDFPGLAKKMEEPKSKVKKPEASSAEQQFPEGFRKGIKKGAVLKPIIKRGKK